MSELPADSGRALRGARAERGDRAAARLPRVSWATTSRRRSPRRSSPRRRRRRSPTGSSASWWDAWRTERIPRPRAFRRRRWRRSWASCRPGRSASAPGGRCSTGSWPRAAETRWRSSRPRGSPRWTPGDELAEHRRRGARGQRRRRRARARRQCQGDRPDRRARDARDQGPRRRHRGGPAGARAARDLSRAAPCGRPRTECERSGGQRVATARTRTGPTFWTLGQSHRVPGAPIC